MQARPNNIFHNDKAIYFGTRRTRRLAGWIITSLKHLLTGRIPPYSPEAISLI